MCGSPLQGMVWVAGFFFQKQSCEGQILVWLGKAQNTFYFFFFFLNVNRNTSGYNWRDLRDWLDHSPFWWGKHFPCRLLDHISAGKACMHLMKKGKLAPVRLVLWMLCIWTIWTWYVVRIQTGKRGGYWVWYYCHILSLFLPPSFRNTHDVSSHHSTQTKKNRTEYRIE